MTPSRPHDLKRPAPRLTLVTPAINDAARFARDLKDALGAADVAAVVLRLADAGERELTDRIKTVAGVVQKAEIALIVDGRPELVPRAGADGAHLTGTDALIEALPGLKPDRIVGAGGMETRHDAMLAAERGADYVMFGEPDEDGNRPSLEAIVERVEWWAEVFQIPCVAFAASLEEIGPLADAGADFVALGDFIFADPRGPKAAMHAAAQHLGMRERAS